VQAGALRVPDNRLGRSGRYLPSHLRVGAAMGWGAEVLMGAALAVNPPPPAAPPATSLFTPAPAAAAGAAPARPRRPVRATAAAAPAASGRAAPARAEPAPDPDLAAIRALLADSAAALSAVPPAVPPAAFPAASPAEASVPPHAPAPRPAVFSDGQPDASGKGWRLALLRDMAATALGYGLFLVALPYGAVRATLAHLDGQDLRDLTAT
jgi:hypothetical protein